MRGTCTSYPTCADVSAPSVAHKRCLTGQTCSVSVVVTLQLGLGVEVESRLRFKRAWLSHGCMSLLFNCTEGKKERKKYRVEPS